MSTTDQSPPGGYSNTNTATPSEGKERNSISINNKNGIRRNNQPGNRSLANFTSEVPSVRSVLGTVAEQCIMKDQFKTFQDKVKQYVLRDFDNPREIIIVFRDLKYTYAHVDMEKTIKPNK